MKRKLKLTQGISMPVSVLFFVVTAGITVGAATLADTGHRVAVAATHKQQANALAETGIHAFYDSVWRQMRIDGTYPASLTSRTLSSSVDSQNRVAGEYSASIVSVTNNTTDLGDGLLQDDYTMTILGYGKAENGTDAEMNATFSGTQIRSTYCSSTTTAAFLPGAVQSNTNVRFKGDGGFKTNASVTGERAHIFANEGVDWTNSSGGGTSAGGTNLTIAGQLLVARSGDPTYYDFTRSRFDYFNSQGIFNSNGSGQLHLADNSTIPAAERTFPSQSQVDAWTSSWEASIRGNPLALVGAASGGAYPLTIVAGAASLSAPTYIDGDLVVDTGVTLTLIPADPDPANNVVMVTGNITNLGTIVNQGVTLFCIGKYTDSPTSDYHVAATSSGTMKAALNGAALVSGSVDPEAITITSDKSLSYGLVYSAKGGVKITGNGAFTGAIVAGCTIPGTQVVIAPSQGGQYVINYQPDCLDNKATFPVSSGLTSKSWFIYPFTPTALTGWTKARAPGSKAG